jgi:Tfp pilus assembly protein PilN
MINLLPPNEKHQLRAARTNTLLIRYNIVFLIAVAFMGLAVIVTYFYLTTTKANAERLVQENRSKVGDYATVDMQATQFRKNLATAKQILGNEVTYSKFIIDIAHLLPSGVILENLNLDAQTFGTQTSLIAQAKTYDNALALKESLQKSSLFSDVHFESIAASGNEATGYPITVNLSVTIKKEAAK